MSEKDSDAVVTVIDSIEPHPNADKLEIGKVFGYDCVIQIGAFTAGQKIAYIPEDNIVAEKTLEKLGMVGMLSGKNGDRIKAKNIRGVLSRGLVYAGPEIDDLPIGMIVNDILGVTKYVPPIPVKMKGETKRHTKFLHYDIENIERFPNIIPENTAVVITEKIHGTQIQIMWDGNEFAVSSKGLGKNGIALMGGNTVYERAMKIYYDSLDSIKIRMNDEPFIIVGEVYGRGIQNLGYNSTLDMRVFEIYKGKSGEGEYLTHDEVQKMLNGLSLQPVPVLYDGLFSMEKVQEFRSGDTLINNAGHIREGIVIKPSKENIYDKRRGRIIIKAISPSYLKKKNNTEYN